MDRVPEQRGWLQSRVSVEPKITDTVWVTEQGYVLPARVYGAETAADGIR
jgi:hypothetical protein